MKTLLLALICIMFAGCHNYNDIDKLQSTEINLDSIPIRTLKVKNITPIDEVPNAKEIIDSMSDFFKPWSGPWELFYSGIHNKDTNDIIEAYCYRNGKIFTYNAFHINDYTTKNIKMSGVSDQTKEIFTSNQPCYNAMLLDNGNIVLFERADVIWIIAGMKLDELEISKMRIDSGILSLYMFSYDMGLMLYDEAYDYIDSIRIERVKIIYQFSYDNSSIDHISIIGYVIDKDSIKNNISSDISNIMLAKGFSPDLKYALIRDTTYMFDEGEFFLVEFEISN